MITLSPQQNHMKRKFVQYEEICQQIEVCLYVFCFGYGMNKYVCPSPCHHVHNFSSWVHCVQICQCSCHFNRFENDLYVSLLHCPPRPPPPLPYTPSSPPPPLTPPPPRPPPSSPSLSLAPNASSIRLILRAVGVN